MHAVMAAKDEYLNLNAIINQTNKLNNATIGDVHNIKPNAEATPLPPLNFNQIGKLCPTIAIKPAIKDAVIFAGVIMLKITISRIKHPLYK